MLSDQAAAISSADFVVDNTDPHVALTGAWTTSTLSSGGIYWGADFVRQNDTAAGTTFSWPLPITEAGRYKIYARWSQSASYTDTAQYKITHDGGVTTVTVNQQQNGGRWRPLGVFDLTPSEDLAVELSNGAASGYAVADAIRVVRDATESGIDEIIIDNAAATTAGDWVSSTTEDGYEDSDYIQGSTSGGTRTVTWTPTLPAAGTYKVYAKWASLYWGVTNARYTVYHDGGSTPVTVNQKQNGGEWVQLGTFALTPGQNHRVVLDNTATGYWVVADAIRLVREPDASAVDIIVDNSDAGASSTGSWANNTYTGGGTYWGANYAYQSSPAGTDVFTWTPTLPSAGRYRVSVRWVEYSGYTDQAEYTVYHAGGSTATVVSQQDTGGNWVVLGVYDLAPGQSHRVELRQLGTSLIAAADAVRFERVGDSTLVAADAARFVRNDAQAVNYLLWDNTFAPRKVADASGAIVWDAALQPFGGESSIIGSAVLALRFPGQYTDPETGRGTGESLNHPLAYNLNRDYDPATGRYIEADPIGLAGGNNLYRYANASPRTYVDPDGQYVETMLDLAFITYDIGKLVQDNIIYDCDNLGENLLALGADTVGAVLPFVTGLGLGIRGVGKADDVYKALKGTRAGKKAARGSKSSRSNVLPNNKSVGDFDAARREAFENAGMTDPTNVNFSKVDPETGTVVEFKGSDGAKVAYDGPHASPGQHHDTQHVSWQSSGKRKSGGGKRGNIPYSGPQHPSRSNEKVQY